jgi:hypothetical protein
MHFNASHRGLLLLLKFAGPNYPDVPRGGDLFGRYGGL